MDTIIFVGDRMSGYFAEEYSHVRGFDYYTVPAAGNDIKKTTNEVLNLVREKQCRNCILIYDVDAYINDAQTIAEEIAGVVKTFSARPIAYMPSFIPESEMAKALISNGIKSFVFSGTSSDLKEQLDRNISGYFDANGRKEIDDIIKKQEEAKASILNFQTIGLAGTQHRIGTTSQALQIVKYLEYKGHSACYIELNSNKYLDANARSGAIRSLSLVEKYGLYGEKKKDKVVFEGIDMFTSQNGLSESLKKQYEYFVFDYGSVTEQDFDRTAFAKDDIRIFVGGCKPTEIDSLETMLSIPLYADANVMISFAPEGEHESILKLISEVRNSVNSNETRPVMFCPYCPDPFVFANPDAYDAFIPVEMTEEKEAELLREKKGKSRGLFRRKER